MYVFTLKDPGRHGIVKKCSADPKPNLNPNHNPYLLVFLQRARVLFRYVSTKPKVLVPGTRGGTGKLSVHDHVNEYEGY
jgi:hypothetical protein